MRAILMNSALTSVESGIATIIAPPRYASGAPKFLTQISDLLTREHGSPLKALIRAIDDGSTIAPRPPDSSAETSAADNAPAEIPSAQPAPRPTTSNSNAADHPLVQHALQLFGGRIVDVQPRKPT